MNNHRLLLGTNWKMHKTVAEATDYVHRLLSLLEAEENTEAAQLFVIPPFTAIDAVRKASDGRLWVGAQNMHWAESGAYTGEISPSMLHELGVDLVELGHAERRQHFNETDPAINLKVLSALQHGLRPLVCIGETGEERSYGVEKETVIRQLRIALRSVPPSSACDIIVAYEPVWAIGHEGAIPDASYIRLMVEHLRHALSDIFGTAGEETSVIYGGDVNGGNAVEILSCAGLDGLFVGRAAWQPEEFAALIRICLTAARRPSEGSDGDEKRERNLFQREGQHDESKQ